MKATNYIPRSTKRTGVLALKAGMTVLYDVNGIANPVTVLQLEDNVVVAQRTLQQHGYTAVQIGAGPVKTKHVHHTRIGEFHAAGVPLKRHLKEFRVSEDALMPVGTQVTADHFVPGQKLDVSGVTIGKGFQGVMKRFGFAGFRASHGTSVVHRHGGAIGACQDPGKVWKGKKMPGRMGGKRRVCQNIRLLAIDSSRDLLFVRGQVPGHAGAYVRVTDAIKCAMQGQELSFPVPTALTPSKVQGSGPESWRYDPLFQSYRESTENIVDTGEKLAKTGQKKK